MQLVGVAARARGRARAGVVLGGWTHAEWWGHELGRRVGWAPWGLEMMQRVGAERCSWSPLERDYDRWCWPDIERLREDNER